MTNINDARNLTLLMDFYELTMAAGYFEEGYTDKVGVFDMFFRKIPGRRRLCHCRGPGAVL